MGLISMTPSITEALAPQAQTISPYLTLYWLHDAHAVLYELTTPVLTRDIIDTTISVITDVMLNWQPNTPYLAVQLLDIGSLLQPGMLAYARYRADKMVATVGAGPSGRVASVMPPQRVPNMFRLWLEREAQHRQPRLAHRLFVDEHQALNWVESGLSA